MVSYNNGDVKVSSLEHMVHYKNLDSILSNGLLSHTEAHGRGLVKEDISMDAVQSIRASKTMDGRVTPPFSSTSGRNSEGRLTLTLDKYDRPLHYFVPLYFNSKNPMLYKRKNIQHELFILLIDPNILSEPDTFFSDGNAAGKSKFFRGTQYLLENLPFEVLASGSWNDSDADIKAEKARQMCAEVLVPKVIPISWIKTIVCIDSSMEQIAKNATQNAGSKATHIDVIQHRSFYF
jgi:ssDNA thymidine ADP-ribosyltransferase, DarT